MPARTIPFISNYYYHVYNRGSEKRVIFTSDGDYQNFLTRMKEKSVKCGVSVLCYCLMPNHFHFLLKQIIDRSIVQFMNTVQLGYAKYFNTKYERVGPLFQGRFKAKMIESDEYLLYLSAYIHKNPISKFDSGNPVDSRNRLRDQLRAFPYSSYREFIGMKIPEISQPKTILDHFSKSKPAFSYEAFVSQFVPDYDTIAPLLFESL